MQPIPSSGCPADVQQLLVVKEEVLPEQQDQDPQLSHIKEEQEDPEPPHIKEEQEELWLSQEFPSTPAPVKAEEDQEKPELDQRQTEEADGGSDPGTGQNKDDAGTRWTKDEAEEASVAEIEVSCDDWEEPGESHHCQKPFICSQCGRRFTRNGYLQTHLRTHTGEKPFNCLMCGKGFTRKSHVEQHKAVHKEEEHLSRVWNRTLGSTSASVASSFHLHPTSSADKPTIDSEFCFSRPLKNKGGAKADQNPLRVQANVTGHNTNIPKKRTKKLKKDLTGKDARSRRKQLHCSECEKMFAFKSCLKRHMRSHTGEKPFSCSDCGTRFTQKSSLRSHMRVHTGEQPFRCGVCQRRFRHKSNFRTHLLTHTGEKPFSCSVCGRRFSIKSSLDIHMRVHTGEKPFNCSSCHKCFGHKSALQIHKKIHERQKTCETLFH